jgi:hypothetical protein
MQWKVQLYSPLHPTKKNGSFSILANKLLHSHHNGLHCDQRLLIIEDLRHGRTLITDPGTPLCEFRSVN